MLRLSVLLCFLLLACGCGSENGSASADAPAGTNRQDGPAFEKEGTLAFMRGSDTLSTLDVEIAETPQERERGLMQRLALPEGSGMLFLFDNNQPRGFWMKNTPMALDIFFANADSQIVRVAKHTMPYSTERIRSEAPAKYVVEVPAGYADRRGIVAGDRIRFRREGNTLPRTDAAPDSLATEPFDARPRSDE